MSFDDDLRFRGPCETCLWQGRAEAPRISVINVPLAKSFVISNGELGLVSLLRSPFDPGGAIIVTGVTGFVGRAIADVLRSTVSRPLVLPVRQRHAPERLQESLDSTQVAGVPSTVLVVNTADDLAHTIHRLRPYHVRAIVHAAGSCHYNSERELVQGNQQLTQYWLDVGRALEVERFVYISTAFCGGRRTGCLPEQLHADGDGEDLTRYMWSKRATEHLVADSGLPYQILRPSILIGHSQTGEYDGRLYGPYQIWAAILRFLTTDDLYDVKQLLGNNGSLPLLHIDMFQQLFLAAWQHLPPHSIMHLVSREDHELRNCLVTSCQHMELISHERQSRKSAEDRIKLWYKHVRVNLQISEHRWQFAQGWLDQLSQVQPNLPSATTETFLTCHEWFQQNHQRFIAKSPAPLSEL